MLHSLRNCMQRNRKLEYMYVFIDDKYRKQRQLEIQDKTRAYGTCNNLFCSSYFLQLLALQPKDLQAKEKISMLNLNQEKQGLPD